MVADLVQSPNDIKANELVRGTQDDAGLERLLKFLQKIWIDPLKYRKYRQNIDIWQV